VSAAGGRVVVTRPAEVSDGLVTALDDAGFDVIRLPLIETRDCVGPATDAGIAALSGADHIVVTSINGARRLGRLVRSGAGRVGDATVVAVGQGTRDALAGEGIRVDLMPREATGAAVAAMLAERGVAGRRVVLARAREGRPELPAGLRAAGAEVLELPLYESVDLTPDAVELARASAAAAWTFTSPRIVDAAVRVAGHEPLAAVSLVSIGPTTSARLREHGLQVACEARAASVAAIVECVGRVTRATGGSPP